MAMFSLQQFCTYSLRSHPRGEAITRILAAAFGAADAGKAVRKYLRDHPPLTANRIFAFGLGKAAIAMTSALAGSIPLADSLIVTKHASLPDFKPVTVMAGNHPIPGEDSLAAGRAAREFASRLASDDLLVCLISGGGSALMSEPLIPLAELQALTSTLLASGARIDEVNTVRRHLDSLKGGGLAQAANGARILSLILSDVVGNSLEAIASGPTAPDPTTTEDAVEIVRRFLPHQIFPFRETAKPNDSIFQRVENQIIASNGIALRAAQQRAEAEGFLAEIIETHLQGEAREVGKNLAEQLKGAIRTRPRPLCLLAGGETTVTVRGEGKGGRNQELALGAVEALRGENDLMLISIATDGEDGPTDAAGAVVTGESAARAELLGWDAPAFLSRNDAYSYFAGLGDLIRTGPSGTNVNDLVLLFAF